MEIVSDEVLSLRRTTRDIIAISSLPSIWAHYNVRQISDSLVETLNRSLSLELAFVLVNDKTGTMHSAFSRSGFLKPSQLETLITKLEARLEKESLKASSVHMDNPLGAGRVQVNFTPIGHSFKNGVLVTATARPDFPNESERLILNIASNLTNVTLESRWSQKEAQRLLAISEDREKALQEATQIAESARLEAETANEMKSSFLANMSHEIRTPLGAILGFTDVLKSSSLTSQERSEYLEIITRSGHSLTKIIDDILDLSKIEAGKLEIESLPLSLPDICKEVISMFSDRATGKGIQLILDDSKFPKFNIGSDPVRIRQVLVNLVGNAVKFTSQGSITISGHYSESIEGKVRTHLTVTDTGIGMSPEVAANLFQPFTQGDNTSTRKFGGTGLGLALSKKLGKALGGDVRLTQFQENVGCTFLFEFTAPKIEAVELTSSEKVQSELKKKEVLKGLRILVADDSPDNRLLMSLVLSKHGAAVQFAENGEEAVQMSLRDEFDAVLMDIQMPVLDGFGALAKLRKAHFTKPVFALTAHAMKEDRNRAIASGFVDHVSKPLNPRALIDSILTHTTRN